MEKKERNFPKRVVLTSILCKSLIFERENIIVSEHKRENKKIFFIFWKNKK